MKQHDPRDAVWQSQTRDTELSKSQGLVGLYEELLAYDRCY